MIRETHFSFYHFSEQFEKYIHLISYYGNRARSGTGISQIAAYTLNTALNQAKLISTRISQRVRLYKHLTTICRREEVIERKCSESLNKRARKSHFPVADNNRIEFASHKVHDKSFLDALKPLLKCCNRFPMNHPIRTQVCSENAAAVRN